MRERKNYLLLGIAIIFALVLRLVWLDRIPIGISGDELDYVFNAKAVWLTGKDITGKWSPFSLTTPPNEIPKAELPYLLISPFIGITDFSLFSARFPFVLFSIGLVIVTYLIAKELLGKEIALITVIISAINPWSIYFGRIAYSETISVFSYLLSLYILLKAKSWKILFAFPFLFIAFFTYIGAKLIFIPFITIVILYVYLDRSNRKYLKQYLVLGTLCLIIFGYYIFILKDLSTGSRLSEILLPTHSSIAEEVNNARRLSIINPYVNIFENKIVVYLKEIISRYFDIFSSRYLFLHGGVRATFSIWKHGMFYYIDALFLFAGFLALLFREKKVLALFLPLILISPLPSLLSNIGRQYSLRSAMLFPFLIIIISVGIWHIINLLKRRRSKYIFSSFLIAIYILLLSNFLYIYFFENPIYNSEAFAFSTRILSNYTYRATKEEKRVIIVSNSAQSFFKEYLFFANEYNNNNKKEIRKIFNKKKNKYKLILYANCNSVISLSKNAILIAPIFKECKLLSKQRTRNTTQLSIAQLSDGGEVYKIFNDKLCSKYRLKRYPTGFKMKDFEVEKLSNKEFCQKFITNPNNL